MLSNRAILNLPVIVIARVISQKKADGLCFLRKMKNTTT